MVSGGKDYCFRFGPLLSGQESAGAYSVSIGPLLLILGLANLFHIRPLEKPEKYSLQLGIIFFLSGWFVWAVGNRLSGYLIQTRMYYSLFPAFAVLAALGWNTVREINWKGVRISRLFGLAVLIALGISTINLGFQTIRQDVLRVNTGMISADVFQDRNLGWYAPAVRSINLLPQGSHVLFLYEPRGLACVPNCDPDEILDQWKISRMPNPDLNSVLTLWKQQGYNYIFVNRDGMDFLASGGDPHHPAEEIQALQEMLKQLPIARSFGASYQLYKLP